jgi:hypothetical protein
LSGMPALGAGGPEFKSRRPDQSILFVLHYLESHIFLLQLLWISRRQEVGFCKSFNLHDFVALCAGKNSKRQECH